MAVTSVGLGTDSTIGVGNAGETAPSGTFDTIGGMTSGTFTIEHNEVDTTNNDDNGYTSFKPGNTTMTLSAEFRFDPTDTAQGVLEDIAADVTTGNLKALRAWIVRPLGAVSGESTWSFDGYVTSFEMNPGTNDEPVTCSIEVKATGQSVGGAAPVWALVP